MILVTVKERAWLDILVKQALTDARYMQQWVDDPNSSLTRGIAERHVEMARWLERVLEHGELATAPAAVRE